MDGAFTGGDEVFMRLSKYVRIKKYDDGYLILNLKNYAQVFAFNNGMDSDLQKLLDGDLNNIKQEEIKKVFLVDDDADEVAEVLATYYSTFFDSSDLSFILMPNNICNFKCIYCYQKHDQKIISNELIDKFIEAVKNYHKLKPIKNFKIEWFGGEPLMTFPIIKKITDELKPFFEYENINYIYGITTNGSLLNRDRIEYLLKNNFKFFQITVDGSRNTHNKTRVGNNGKGTWDTIIENLMLLNEFKEYDFNVFVRVNFNNEIIEEIDELLEFISKNLDDRFKVFFHSIGKWGGENDDILNTIDYKLEPYLLKLLVEKQVNYGLDPIANYIISSPFEGVCYASKPYSFTLGTDGKLRKCNEEDKEKDVYNVVGTIENGYIEINKPKWAKFVLPNGSYGLSNKCIKCEYLPLCCGQGCPINRFENGADSCHSSFAIIDDLVMLRIRYLLNKK